MEPASIRYKNPGAQWPGPVSKKFGSTKHVVLKDGQSNKIAVFDTFEQGAAAQFYLWATRYTGMTLEAAIKKWSGHNSSKSYADHMKKKVGISMSDLMTKEYLAGPDGWKFMKAQAQWEAGKAYPMTDEQWQAGQALAFGKVPATKTTADTAAKTARAVGLGTAGVGAASQVVSAVTGPVTDTVQIVQQTVDTGGQVVDVSKQVVSIAPVGFWQNTLALVQSPKFLAVALLVVLIAWGLTYWLRTHREQQ